MQKTGEDAFRNIIVLRSIIYVFLLGHRTGRIVSGDENLRLWGKIIEVAHHKANALSVEEVKRLATGTVEARVITRIASEIFDEIQKLPPVEMA